MAIAYIPLVLPADTAPAARRIAFEHAAGGTVYRRPDGSHVLARASWTYPPPSALAVPDPLPAGWTVVTAPS